MKTMTGAISFFELGVADTEKGRAFYEGLFGWEFETGPSGNGWMLHTPGVPGGMHPGDPEAVPEAVLAAVGARETVLRGAGAEELRGGGDLLARLVEHCAGRRMLLILDNCEHLVAAAAELAESLLARCPGLRVLATSREPLGVPGEVLRPLGPLPAGKALRLFGERGASVRAGFRTVEKEIKIAPDRSDVLRIKLTP